MSGAGFRAFAFDGILGLGFPALTSDDQSSPVVDNLMKQGALPTGQFAFYLHPDASQGGAVLWGGVDERLYEGTLQWFYVEDPGYWNLNLAGIKVGDRKWAYPKAARRKLLVDSGTTFFVLPGPVFDMLYRKVGFDGPCDKIDKFPNLVYSLTDIDGSDVQITVKPEEYMVRSGTEYGTPWCTIGVQRSDEVMSFKDDLAILGEVFMRRWFTVFKREGWGPGRNGAASSFWDARIGLARTRVGPDVDEFFNQD